MLKTLKMFLITAAVFLSTTAQVFAQEERTNQVQDVSPSFTDIIYGGSFVNLGIWILIMLASFAMIALFVDAIMQTRREKILPPHLIIGVRDSLNEGDLDSAPELSVTSESIDCTM